MEIRILYQVVREWPRSVGQSTSNNNISCSTRASQKNNKITHLNRVCVMQYASRVSSLLESSLLRVIDCTFCEQCRQYS